jgi:hypothetical protein
MLWGEGPLVSLAYDGKARTDPLSAKGAPSYARRINIESNSTPYRRLSTAHKFLNTTLRIPFSTAQGRYMGRTELELYIPELSESVK